MSRMHKPSLLTVGSTKGGTGKTTTLLNLAELLARYIRVCVVDLHYDNPQHARLFGGTPKREPWLRYIEQGKHITPKFCYDLDRVLCYGPDTKMYKKRESGDNLWFAFQDPNRKVKHEHALRDAFKPKPHKLYTDEQSRRLQYTLPLFHELARSGRFDFILADIDAGNTDVLGSIGAVLHRGVEGYVVGGEEKELLPVGVKPYLLTEPLEKCFGNEKPFENGFRLVITSPSVSDIETLKDREERFPPMGQNNHYHIVVNKISQRYSLEGLAPKVRKLLPEGVFEKRVYLLHDVGRVGFGNITDEGYQLTIHGSDTDQVDYKNRLKKLANELHKVRLSE